MEQQGCFHERDTQMVFAQEIEPRSSFKSSQINLWKGVCERVRLISSNLNSALNSAFFIIPIWSLFSTIKNVMHDFWHFQICGECVVSSGADDVMSCLSLSLSVYKGGPAGLCMFMQFVQFCSLFVHVLSMWISALFHDHGNRCPPASPVIARSNCLIFK